MVKQQFPFDDPFDSTTKFWVTFEGPVPLTEEQGKWLTEEAPRRGLGNIIDGGRAIIQYDSLLPIGYPICLGNSDKFVVRANGRDTYGEILLAVAEGRYNGQP